MNSGVGYIINTTKMNSGIGYIRNSTRIQAKYKDSKLKLIIIVPIQFDKKPNILEKEFLSLSLKIIINHSKHISSEICKLNSYSYNYVWLRFCELHEDYKCISFMKKFVKIF